MDVNYDAQNFMSNHSLETEYYDSTTVYYSEDNSNQPVTEFSNETTCFDQNWPDCRDDFWEQYKKYFLYLIAGLLIIIYIVYLLLFIIGFVGNCMVILVVIKRPQMRTVTNLFIMNLAVADLLVIVFCFPAEILHNIYYRWLLGPVMCKIVRYMEWISMCASAYSLTAISFDRCKAIYRPQVPPRGLSKRQALFAMCLIWTISLTLTIPSIVVVKEVYSSRTPYCNQVWDGVHNGLYYVVGALVFFYGLPIIVIVISNIIIWSNVSERKAPEECASSRVDRMHRETRQSVSKILGIVTLAFLLSWLPLYYYMTMAYFMLKYLAKWEHNFLKPMALFLAFSNSCVNPILYAFLSRQFREAFKVLLPKWMPCVHSKGNNRENSCASRETMTNDTSL